MYSIDENFDIEAQHDNQDIDTNSSIYQINDELLEYYVAINILETNMNVPYITETELQLLKSYPSITFKKFMRSFNKRILISQKVKKQTVLRHHVSVKTITINNWCNACNCDIKKENLANHINSLDSLIVYNHNNFIIEYIKDIDQLKNFKKECVKIIKNIISYHNSQMKFAITCDNILTFFKKPLIICGLFIITIITIIIIVIV